jgi:allophanate hydrolase subunit 2
MRFEWGSGGRLLRDGQDIGVADNSWWRERAAIDLGPDAWEFRADGKERVAVLDGQVRCRARRTSFWSEAWEIQAESGSYSIRPRGVFTGRLAVERGNAPIGEIVSAGFWAGRPALEIAVDLPLVDAVFLLWIGYIIRNRRNAAASGGSPGAS